VPETYWLVAGAETGITLILPDAAPSAVTLGAGGLRRGSSLCATLKAPAMHCFWNVFLSAD
jgi:hypothetical protein